uniref:Chromosome transmission fidelity protein 18 homolog n=1 Tax=Sphenodon punctatus TaxID=8508 RepID=A0A8D0L4C1_SPHPU
MERQPTQGIMEEHELYGIEDEFEEQFADELEVLAGMEGGWLCLSSRLAQGVSGWVMISMGALSPKSKRPRLEAVKKLDFGAEEGSSALDCPSDDITPPPSPGARSNPRGLPFLGPESSGGCDMVPLHVTPPPEKESKRVLKRPPILEDYINVTSVDGTRVFLALKDDPSRTGAGLPNSLGWNRRRPLHLLGVPFSYLKEQVMEEVLCPILITLPHEPLVDVSCCVPGHMEEEEEEESTLRCLWVDRFTPRHYVELLSDDYTNRCLLKWLKLWDEVVFGREKPVKISKPSTAARPPFKQAKEQQTKWKTKSQLTEEILEAELDQHKRPKHKVALLCGPPGLGKTTLAHVIAKHAGYNVVEMNASDDRSPDAFKTRIEAATQMKSVLGANEKPNCLIIDEIDGAPTASINVLLGIVNHKGAEAETQASAGGAGSRKRRKEGGLLLRPIICICNDQYVPSLRQLRQQGFLLNFPQTAPSRLVQRLHEIAVRQGMKVDTGALMALCEKSENDIRSCINTLQFLHNRGKKELSARMVRMMKIGLKDQNKGLFSIWQEIFQLPKIQRQRIGIDPSMPDHILAGGDGNLLSVTGGRVALSASAQRFHHILHLAMSSGEHEKLTQGLYDNFLNMKLKDSTFGSVCLALEWLGFSDVVNSTVLHGQNFQLMRYLPFLPVAFHLLFAASNVPRLAYPSSHYEALTKLNQMQNLVASMILGVAPSSRSRTGPRSLILEVLCLLLDILSPKLRPVSEPRRVARLHPLNTPENVEEVCRFPDLPLRKPLTYQAKQLVAREIELEKMRRTEAVLQAPRPKGDSLKTGAESAPAKSSVRNHEQRLEHIVKKASSIEEKVNHREQPDFPCFPTGNQISEREMIEKQIGTAVGRSDVWFRFNEGVSNAVRRNIYIKDLL